MKLLTTLFFLGIISIFAYCSAQQEAKSATVTVDDARNFNLRCHSNDDKNASMPSIAKTIYAQYNSKEKKTVLSFDKTTLEKDTDNITLLHPLDFKYFTQKFDSLFGKDHSDRYLDHGSHLEVFYWLVSMHEKMTEMPVAGKVLLSQYVKLSDNDSDESYTERALSVAGQISELRNLNAQLNSATREFADLSLKKNELGNRIKLIETEIVQFNLKIKKSNDTIPPESIQNRIDSINSIKINLDSIISSIDITLNFKDGLNYKINSIKSNINQKQEEIAKKGIYEVSEVKMQFENGFLERIQVSIQIPATNRHEIFENAYPIGFSSISNYKNFSRVRLFRRSSKYEPWDSQQYIYLSDIIEMYDNELDLLTKDYSPGDTSVTVSPGTTPIVKLNKLKTFYIIDGKTFTDVNGFSENSPNGLVQVELNRRFNLLTHRFQVRGSNNYGFVNYVNARVNFSKIEDKLKGLPLRNQLSIENKTVVSPNYASNLDYLRYENLGINLEVNAFLFDAPDFKYTFYIDAGLHYGHTPVIDSNYKVVDAKAVAGTPRQLDAHNFTVFPRAKLQLFAEKRYGLTLSYQMNYTWLFSNNNFKQVLSYSGKGLDLTSLTTNRTARLSSTIEAAMFFDPNPQSSSGKIFTKAIFHFQKGDVNTFYPQILLGYAFNIFK